jgi:hypothetical protein
MHIDLSAPIWAIEHVAAALHLEVDTAREYTYRADFPAPRAGFSRNLWTREKVLAWFSGLPPKPRGRAKTGGATGTISTATVARSTSRPANTRPASAPAGTRPANAPRPITAPKPYTPRRK